ncbi:Stress-response A/B barrel domain-containing protein [Psidium guajava]|nr:Stress-response A/B barrel domain-containing protein [Psidium guajava]
MEAEAKGMLKRVLLFKFKVETALDRIKQLIERYSNLVKLVESLKSWHMYSSVALFPFIPPHLKDKDVSMVNLHEGFTHVYELTVESGKGSAEYVAHPAHLEFHELCWPHR